jgi:hypothetical protein
VWNKHRKPYGAFALWRERTVLYWLPAMNTILPPPTVPIAHVQQTRNESLSCGTLYNKPHAYTCLRTNKLIDLNSRVLVRYSVKYDQRKFGPVYPMIAFWGITIAPLLLNIGSRWMWAFSFTLRSLYSRRKNPLYSLSRKLMERWRRFGDLCRWDRLPLPGVWSRAVQPVAPYFKSGRYLLLFKSYWLLVSVFTIMFTLLNVWTSSPIFKKLRLSLEVIHDVIFNTIYSARNWTFGVGYAHCLI